MKQLRLIKQLAKWMTIIGITTAVLVALLQETTVTENICASIIAFMGICSLLVYILIEEQEEEINKLNSKPKNYE